jgi:hypothetical protein
MGVTEVAVREFFRPIRNDVIEMMSDAFHGAFGGEIPFVKPATEIESVGDAIERGLSGASLRVLAPTLAGAVERFGVHPPVGAVAVEEKGFTEVQLVFVAV